MRFSRSTTALALFALANATETRQHLEIPIDACIQDYAPLLSPLFPGSSMKKRGQASTHLSPSQLRRDDVEVPGDEVAEYVQSIIDSCDSHGGVNPYSRYTMGHMENPDGWNVAVGWNSC
ncbi:hypothetical protein F4780DRAFT_777231 [Xylariomycetidae sp. FL0641]|nr:hypothetical protein F4780DRAFT_777231 [Xylariomycetidae sp. FL0641]